MTTRESQSPQHGVLIGRRVLQQLRTSLERGTGVSAAPFLQEAGFAGGEELFTAFQDRLRGLTGLDHPGELDIDRWGEQVAEFFAETGWGRLAITPIAPSVLALDAPDWAEAQDDASAEFPSCHITCGLLADFLARSTDGLVAVMEVECRSRGDSRCRFIAGAPETLSLMYDRMGQGLSYAEALGVER